MSTRDKCVLIITTIFALAQAEGNAELTLAKDCQVHFATVAEARVHLAKRDVYIEGLSPFERAAKIKQANASLLALFNCVYLSCINYSV